MATIPDELQIIVEQLPPHDQQRVLAYARGLAHAPHVPRSPLPPGTPPESVLRFTVSPEVGDAMERALEDCERVDLDE